jgi:hypothetical protein
MFPPRKELETKGKPWRNAPWARLDFFATFFIEEKK